MVIYADLIFFANLVSVLLLLLCYSIIFSVACRTWRYILAAVMAGCYGVAELVFGLWYPMRLAVMVGIVLIALGRTGICANTARFACLSALVGLVFTLISALIGSNAYIARATVTVFMPDVMGALVCILSYPVLIIIARIAREVRKWRSALLIIGKRRIRLFLLYDSGNLLRHKGESVAVVTFSAIEKATEYDSYAEFLANAHERTTFKTVSDDGTMPVITPDRAYINGREVHIAVAVTDREFNGYDGIIGI